MLRLVQLLWFLMLLATTLLLVAAIPARLAQLSQVVPQLDISSGTLGIAEAAVMAQMGWSISFYAAYVTFFEALTAFGGILVGAIIFGRQRHDLMAFFVSIALITLGTFPTPLMTSLLVYQPTLYPLITVLQFIAFGPSLLLLYLFPDRRFVPRWTVVIGAAWLAYSASWLLFPALKPPLTLFAVGTMPLGMALFIMTVLLTGVYSQIYRYRRVATPTERQQTKWIVFGFSMTLVLIILAVVASRFVSFVAPTRTSMLFLLIVIPVIVLGLLMPPVAVMFSILKYRLWDIDVIIRRTVTYALSTAVLIVFYFGGVIVLQRVFALFIGAAQNEIITVISTLVIAALFIPLRNRIQNAIDKRFNRKKYDAQKVLEHFALMVRDETDLETLSNALVNVVQETMQPKSVSVWLKAEGGGKKTQ